MTGVMVSNILTTFQERLRREMNDVADHIATGGCLSVGSAADVAMEYAKQSGKVEGLAIAERLLLDVAEESEKAEEMDK